MLKAFEAPYQAYYLSLTANPATALAQLEGTPISASASDIQKAQYYGVLSQAYYTLIYPQKALDSVQQALTFIDSNEQPWLYHHLRLFEALAFEMVGQITLGVDGVKEALEWSEMNDATSIYLMALYTQSIFHTTLDDFASALKYAQKGYLIAPLDTGAYKRGDFAILLAQVHEARKDYLLAIPYYEEAEIVFRANKQLNTLSLILYGLGRANYSVGNIELGQKNLEESLSISKEINDTQGEAYSLLQLANINIKQENFSLARMQLLSAKDIFINANNRKANISTGNLLATIALQQNNTEMAEYYIQEVEQELVRKEMPDIALTLDETRSTLLFQQEKYKESYELLKSVYSKYKSHRNQQSSDQLHQIRVDYDLKSQELENDVLLEQNLRQSNEINAQRNRNLFLLVIAILAVAFSALMVILIYRSMTNRRKLEILATTDELTGLYNRRYILSYLKKQISQSERYKSDLCVAMIDLDWFKKINDSFGHATGDQVLRLFAKLCTQNLRSSDVIGRIGGEEFLIILPHTDCSDALTVMEKIRSKMIDVTNEMDITGLDVTISIGLSKWMAGDLPEDVMQFADNALYQIKNSGRNQVLLWDRDA
ncbi:diguanylate cyclase [Pseudocolwellia sp. HL-MZ19]|uniref:GGDEF domain-containing protein n=1 Tax=unclassified Pseudocolwellia TaxID=2848178 RepID=UPI003CEAFD97